MTFRRLRIAVLAIAGALALGGCGARGDADPGPPVARLTLHGLSSLTNYRARLTEGTGRDRMTIDTRVHSPANWASRSGSTVLHIGSMSYVQVGDRWLAHAAQPDAYAQSNLPSFARQLYRMTRVGGARVRRGGACHEAGLPGRTWTVTASAGSTFGETLTACVANGSGALLKLVIATSGAAMNARYAREVYEITAVGSVAAFQAPVSPTGP